MRGCRTGEGIFLALSYSLSLDTFYFLRKEKLLVTGILSCGRNGNGFGVILESWVDYAGPTVPTPGHIDNIMTYLNKHVLVHPMERGPWAEARELGPKGPAPCELKAPLGR